MENQEFVGESVVCIVAFDLVVLLGLDGVASGKLYL